MVNKIDAELLVLLHRAVSESGERRVTSALLDLANAKPVENNGRVALNVTPKLDAEETCTPACDLYDSGMDLLTVQQVAQQLGLHESSVRRICIDNNIGRKAGIVRLLSPEEVELVRTARRPMGRPKKSHEVA